MIPTWYAEIGAVMAVLSGVVYATHGSVLESIGATAVLFSFAHGQVADRLAEREAARRRPDVECHAMARRYFVAKEALWFVYFAWKGSYAALAGVVLFLAYPVWRRFWRRRHPLPVRRDEASQFAVGDIITFGDGSRLRVLRVVDVMPQASTEDAEKP